MDPSQLTDDALSDAINQLAAKRYDLKDKVDTARSQARRWAGRRDTTGPLHQLEVYSKALTRVDAHLEALRNELGRRSTPDTRAAARRQAAIQQSNVFEFLKQRVGHQEAEAIRIQLQETSDPPTHLRPLHPVQQHTLVIDQLRRKYKPPEPASVKDLTAEEAAEVRRVEDARRVNYKTAFYADAARLLYNLYLRLRYGDVARHPEWRGVIRYFSVPELMGIRDGLRVQPGETLYAVEPASVMAFLALLHDEIEGEQEVRGNLVGSGVVPHMASRFGQPVATKVASYVSRTVVENQAHTHIRPLARLIAQFLALDTSSRKRKVVQPEEDRKTASRTEEDE